MKRNGINVRKFLAITADDYGPHPYINRGVIDAIKHNKVTSVGVMTNHYESSNVPEYVYDLNKEVELLVDAINDENRDKTNLSKIGIGAHLTLSSGAPITNNPILVHNKNIKGFQHIGEFTFGNSKKHLEAVQAEIEAQILTLKKILDPKGIKIDHISCHQGLLYLYGPYHKALISATEKIYSTYSLEDRPTIRTTIPISKRKKYKKIFKSRMKREGYLRAAKLVDDNLRRVGKLIFGTGSKKLNGRDKVFESKGYVVPQFFFDNFYKKSSLKELTKIGRNFPNSYTSNRGELVVHLGDPFQYYVHLELPGINSGYFKGRKQELEVLKEIDLFEYAKKYSIDLVDMGKME